MPIPYRGQKGFLIYVKERMPDLYARIKDKVPTGNALAGLGLVDPTSTATQTAAPTDWATMIQNIANTAAQVYLTKEQIQAQNKILNLQLSRAQQGLAPLDLDPSIYGLPSAGVTVGMSPDMKKMLIFGGLGLAAVFLLSRR
jgi:hypothetical protein